MTDDEAGALGQTLRWMTGPAVDRLSGRLAGVAGGDLGRLTAVETGAGDSHRGGQAVAVVRCEHGTVVYKPRPMQVDAQLARLLAAVTAEDAPEHRIMVPPVVARDGYGW